MFRDSGLQIRSPAESGIRVGRRCLGMKAVQAVDIGNVETMTPQYRCQRQKSYGFGPEIIGGKIMYPGIDQKDMGSVGFHNKYRSWILHESEVFICKALKGEAIVNYCESLITQHMKTSGSPHG